MHGQKNIKVQYSLKTPYQQPSTYSQFSLKLCTYKPPGTLIESDSTVCCMCTTVSI